MVASADDLNDDVAMNLFHRLAFVWLCIASTRALPSKEEWRRASQALEQSQSDTVEFEFTFDGGEARVRIRLRPDLSAESAFFMREAARTACTGEYYRNEHDFLIQGRLKCGRDAPVVKKGACPPGTAVDPNRKCFAHDPQCGCHGPIMTHGMVGWAGGGAGPDFFIYTGARVFT